MGRIRIFNTEGVSDYEYFIRGMLTDYDRKITTATAVKLIDDDSGRVLVIRGHDFVFDNGEATSGTVTSVVLKENGIAYATLDRFNDTLVNVMADVNAQAYTAFTERLGPTRFFGNIGIDVCVTGSGNDTIHAGDNIDEVWGQGGNDIIFGEGGDNTLLGGEGADTIHGGPAFDYTSYRDSPVGLKVSLTDPAINTGYAAGDVYDQVEGIEGSDFADRLTGSDILNAIYARGGSDIVWGGAGGDFLYGMGGRDRLTGGADGDYMEGGAGRDRFIYMTAGEGNDTIADFAGRDKMVIHVAGFDPQIGIDPASHGFADPNINFIVDGAPTAAEGTFLYSSFSGVLSFDPDGSGSAFAVVIATFNGAPTLDDGDFILT